MAGPSDELRAIFRDELEDLLGVIEASSSRLAAAGPGEDAHERAALEIRRAFHTLKGAAQAVGERSIESTCHEAEVAIAAQPGEIAAIAGVVARALPLLRRGLAAIERELGAGRGATTEPASAVERGPAAHEPGAAAPAIALAIDRDADAAADAPRAGDGAAAGDAARAGDTVRVQLERVDAVLAAADELRAVAIEARPVAPLEDLRAALDAVRAALEPLARDPDALREVDLARARARAALSAAREAIAVADEAARAARSGAASLERGVGALGAELRALRLAPFAALLPGLERAAREAAATLGKEIDVRASGEGVELDRRTRDELREPLLHLVRNAVDHGIEPPAERARAGKPARGVVSIEPAIVGGELRVVVADDGRGVDREAVAARARELGLAPVAGETDPLAWLFEPGFTTRPAVGPISGRGIGLDVVRDRIARLHGRVDVRSEAREGTQVELRIPLSSGAVRVVHARSRQIDLLLPSSAIVRARRVLADDVVTIEGRLHARPDDGDGGPDAPRDAARAPIPMARLDATLGLAPPGLAGAEEGLSYLIASAGGRVVALGVDALVGELEVVVRSLGGRIKRIAGVSGTAMLPDGHLGLVIDVAAAVRLAVPMPASEREAPARARRVLVADDSVTTRALQRALLEAAGYEVEAVANGREALDRLSEAAFDALVSDIEMPLLDGLALLERVRALPRTRTLPVVLVTALDRETDRRRALELGASAYVLKRDFDRERLLATLEDVL